MPRATHQAITGLATTRLRRCTILLHLRTFTPSTRHTPSTMGTVVVVTRPANHERTPGYCSGRRSKKIGTTGHSSVNTTNTAAGSLLVLVRCFICNGFVRDTVAPQSLFFYAKYMVESSKFKSVYVWNL